MNKVYADIDKAKKIVTKPRDEFCTFKGFNPSYIWTNEHISKYLDLVEMENKQNALSVLASGDHAFILVSEGIKDIDTFDVNEFTEYYALGLKRSMLMKYSYKEYLKYMKLFLDLFKVKTAKEDKKNKKMVNELIADLLPVMEKEYRLFWQNINDFLHANPDTNFSNLFIIPMRAPKLLLDNAYLQDATNYRKFQHQLGQSNITFKPVDITRLSEVFSKKYDLILLSNILDYMYREWGNFWGYPKLQEFEQDLESIVNVNGVVFLNYIYNYYLGLEMPIMNSQVSSANLDDEKYFRLNPHGLAFSNPGILLKIYRKK